MPATTWSFRVSRPTPIRDLLKSLGLWIIGVLMWLDSIIALWEFVWSVSEDGEPEDNFLPAQWEALVAAVFFALEVYPGIKIVGHHDLDHRKTCPNFDAQAWAQRHGFPTP